MGNSEKNMENKTKKEETQEDTIISEELVRWMTEGTDPNYVPRSDCG